MKKLYVTILIYLIAVTFEPLQLFIYNCGNAIGVNMFTMWFIFLSLFNLTILATILNTKLHNAKIIISIDILRNIICALPIIFPKLYYVFYNGLNGIDLPYLYNFNIYITLTWLEFALIGFYGIVDWFINNINLGSRNNSVDSQILQESKES